MTTTFVLTRTDRRTDACLGRLCLETYPLYYTLEPPWRDNRQDVSCIPCGRYPLDLTMSARFGRLLPLVMDVPGRVGVRLHRGNWVGDTTGCVLPGLSLMAGPQGIPGVGDSRLAEVQLVRMLRAALDQGPCWLKIMEG